MLRWSAKNSKNKSNKSKDDSHVFFTDNLDSDDDSIVLIDTNDSKETNAFDSDEKIQKLLNVQKKPTKPTALKQTKSVPSKRSFHSLLQSPKHKKKKNRNKSKETQNRESMIYSGYLWKCGKIVKNWKLRYFVFCSDNQLRYYTSSALENCKGIADLSADNVLSVDIDRNHSDSVVSVEGGIGYPFIIFCKNRTWKFRARTARERQQWLKMLRAAVQNSESKTNKKTKTLANADMSEDAMDIFGQSLEQYLYTVHIYQCKNIRRSKEWTEPNIYIRVEFNQCKSGNKYQTSIVYGSIDPIFNSVFNELANKSEFENITFTLYHRSHSLKSDEMIGTLVIDMCTFTAWDKWVWFPIISESEQKFESSNYNNL